MSPNSAVNTDYESQRQTVEQLRDSRTRIDEELSKVIVGQQEVRNQLLYCLFAGGHCLITGVPGLARGATVVVLSDGWDRGEPELLGAEVARLSRVAHRLVWVNPLKASPGYEPLARGMAAALPHVDEFLEGHSLDSLEHLAEVISK